MFRIDENHNYLWPVKVKVPVDGGIFREDVFTTRFKVLPQERVEAIIAARRAGGDTSEGELLEEVVAGWDDIGDEAGRPLPFTAENLKKLLALPYVRVAMLQAYFDSISGRAFAAKN